MRKLVLVVAVLLLTVAPAARAQFCPGAVPYVFTDVPANDAFCGYITWMAQEGVTTGCVIVNPSSRLYCPNDFVTRKQMSAFMFRLGDALFPSTCAAGQVMKWNGLAWACADDNLGGSGGGGTVTSVAASTGLQAVPNPIVGAGTLSVAPAYRLPQGCGTNEIAKWNGSAWICATALTSLSQGSGIVLTPNPIVATGTVAADTGYLQRRVSGTCAAGSSIRVINADGTVACETDDGGGAGGWSLTGNAGTNPTTQFLGTTDNQALVFRVNNVPALRVEPNAVSPNIVGGNPSNTVVAGVRGATIGGGGVAPGDTDPDFEFEAPNRIADHYGTIGGGYSNLAGDGLGTLADQAFATVGGGGFNAATKAYATVAGGGANRAAARYSAVGGGEANQATADYATIAGGRANSVTLYAGAVGGGTGNTAGASAVVGGGSNNGATGGSSTIAGGDSNSADGQWASVGGGLRNTTGNGWWSVVGGGFENVADGSFSTVPGGEENRAGGRASVAMGTRANANHEGCFVFADHELNEMSCGGANRVIFRGRGGFWLFTGGVYPNYSGAHLASGSGAWALWSDRAAKDNFAAVDSAEVLARLSRLSIATWNWTTQDPGIRHMGPTAQDFRTAFGLGESDRSINTVDAHGVALAAIQGLNIKLEERDSILRGEMQAKDAELATLRSESDALRREMRDLRSSHQKEIADLRLAVELLLARASGEARSAQSGALKP